MNTEELRGLLIPGFFMLAQKRHVALTRYKNEINTISDEQQQMTDDTYKLSKIGHPMCETKFIVFVFTGI